MGDLLLVDFASRSKAYTKQPEQTLEQQAVAIVGGLSLDCDPEVLLEFAAGGAPLYESSIGYVAPDKDPA